LHVKVINLQRSTDRLTEFMSCNSHLTDVSIFPAVDGQCVDIRSLAERGLVTQDILSAYSVRALGCALSHSALWDMCIAGGDILTIAEDDTVFNARFDGSAEKVIDKLPAEWDLIIWGWNFDLFVCFELFPGVSHCLAQFEQDRMTSNIGLFHDQSVSPLSFKLLWAFGTPCYTVSPKGAHTLKSRLLPLRPKKILCPEGIRAYPYKAYYHGSSIDHALNGIYRQLDAFVCFPPLVVTKNELAKSTVQKRSDRKVPTHRTTASGEQNRPEEELASCDKRLAMDPGDLAAINKRGMVLWRLGRYAEALANYDRALALAPNAVEVLFNRSVVLREMGRYDEALFTCDRALAIRPVFMPALKERGMVLQHLGRFEEALESYDRARVITV
jgi:GR25 family glycosyltransferase involved in LPS biosynthesis